MDKTQEKIYNKFIAYVLLNKKRPASIHTFMEGLKLKEGTFYKYFHSFDELVKEFWKTIFDRTLQEIQSQEVYVSYSVNEKLLAFYFSWVEALKDYREYIKYVIEEEKIYQLYPDDFELFKLAFEDYSAKLVEEGLATEEIASRMYLTDKYKYVLWYQPVSIVKFWVKDESKNFEDTDALIEKTVNFSFDLMRSNGIDSFFDLAKFHIQHF